MGRKEDLRKELEKLAVEGVEIDKSIAKVLSSAENLWKDKKITDAVALKELKDKLNGFEKELEGLGERKKDMLQKKRKLLIEYQRS